MVALWLRQSSAPESQHHHGFLLQYDLSLCFHTAQLRCGEVAIQQLAPLRWPLLSCCCAAKGQVVL